MQESNISLFWREHLQTIERNGYSIAAYAREHSLSAQSLYGWRYKLRVSKATSETRVRFAEVVTTSLQPRGGVRVHIADTVLEFDTVPDSSWLADFLQRVTSAR